MSMTKEIFITILILFGISFVYSFNQKSYLKLPRFYNNRNKRNVIYNASFMSPKITYESQQHRSIEDPVRIPCKVSGNPRPKITWYMGNQAGNYTEIIDSDKNILHTDGRLEISTTPTVLDSYFCKAENIFGSALSKRTLIQKVFSLPITKIKYNFMDVYVNQKAVISCDTDQAFLSDLLILKYWEIRFNKQNPIQISKTEGRYSVITTTKTFQLHIRNITYEDFNYTQVRCSLSNKLSPNDVVESESWVNPLKYSSRNIFDISFEMCQGREIKVQYGSTVELPWCSRPKTIKVTWYKSSHPSSNSYPINFKLSTKYKLVSEQFGNLLIYNVDVSDEGYYFVKSDETNSLNSYTPFHIRVQLNVGVQMDQSEVMAKYGETVSLSCRVTGYPTPTVNWFHNSKKLPITTQTIWSRTSKSIELKFNVNISTAGVYQCMAESADTMENDEMTTRVMLSAMPPKLISQSPIKHGNEYIYSIDKLYNDTSVVNIRCTFNSIPDATIVWYLDDQPIPIVNAISPSSRKIIPFAMEYSLQIDLRKLSSIGEKWKYGGVYRVVATNEQGNASCNTLIFVSGVFKIRPPKNTILLHGQMLSLNCYVISESMPEISWSRIKKGKVIRLPESHHQIVSTDKREFKIGKIEKSDHEGVYTCQAILNNAEISQNFTIDIERAPMVLTHLPNQIFLSSSSESQTTYTCLPRMYPDKPWYAWWEYQYSKTFDNSSTIIKVRSDRSTNIEGLTAEYKQTNGLDDNSYRAMPKDVPEFLNNNFNQPVQIWVHLKDELHLSNITCVISNHAGTVRHTMVIKIINIGFEIPPPPQISIIMGKSFELNCTAQKKSIKTTVTWKYKQNDQSENYINVNTSYWSRIHQLPKGRLVVKNITLQDPHMFMCLIKSSINNDTISKLVKVDVKVPAKILPMNAIMDIQKHSYTIINCTVFGDNDELFVKWSQHSNNFLIEKQNKKMDPFDPKSKIKVMSFVLENVDDSDEGSYTCTAINKFNDGKQVTESVQLNVVDVPSEVNIDNDTIGIKDRQISLSWKEPSFNGKKPILNYVVHVVTNNNVWDKDVKDTRITLDNLRPHTSYTISVQAKNSVGLGKIGASHTITTNQAVPEGPIFNLTAISTTSTSFIIKWSPPDPLLVNGKIKHYQVCYQKKPENNDSNNLKWSPSIDIISENRLSTKYCRVTEHNYMTLTELAKYQVYAFRVVVVNDAGPGPPAYSNARTMDDVPDGAPTQVTCSYEGKTLSLLWNPPPHNLINGVLKKYEIVYFQTDHQDDPDIVEYISNTKYTLNKVLPNTNYTIRIKVVNDKGSGPPSDALQCKTSEAAPNAPSKVKAFFVNETCILVSWTRPSEPNGVLRDYNIRLFTLNERRESVYKYNINIPINNYYQHDFCDLSSNDKYNVSISARNSFEGASITSTVEPYDQAFRSRIVSFPDNIVAKNNSKIVLDCETIPPTNDIKWKFKDMELNTYENNGSYIFTMTSENTGIYTCSVHNHYVINYNVSLKQLSRGVPLAPKIDFHNVSLNTIFLSWSSAGSPKENGPIISFFAKITDLSGNMTMEIEVAHSSRSLQVPNLHCGSKYKVDIFARNLVGNGSSDTIFIRTTGTKPIIPNTSTMVNKVYQQSICFDLTTFLPGQDCYPDHYRITLQPSNQGEVQYDNTNTINTNVSWLNIKNKSCFNVTNLHPATDYKYVIEAFNRNGSVNARGNAKTLQMLGYATPTIFTNHSVPTNEWSTIIVVASVVVVIIVIVSCTVYLQISRKKITHNMHPTTNIRNELPNRSVTNKLPETPATHRNRKLPTPPDNNNVYHKGISSLETAKQDDDEDDDMLKPYATYESVSKMQQDPMASRNISGRHGAPYMASQTHSYQYPDMMDNQQHLMPVDSVLKTYENDLKQPLLNQTLKVPGRQYDKGYSIGESRPTSTLRPQNVRLDANPNLEAARGRGRGFAMVPASISESEAYRPSSSLCSSTTESSTKEELSQVFRSTFNNQFSSRLQEQDEDGSSTARDNRSTIINRSRHINHTLSDDSTQPESYCESGSSGDDCGIRNFTQDPPGRQVIAPTSIRQFQTRTTHPSTSYDIVDRPQQMIQVSSNNFIQFPSRNPLPEEEEEDESFNYTDNFVVV